MNRRRKTRLLVSVTIALLITGYIAFHRSHRVAAFSQSYLGIDLNKISFGASPDTIPGVKPSGQALGDNRSLQWYAIPGSFDLSKYPFAPAAEYGFTNGRLVEIWVTRKDEETGYRFLRELFVHSLDPRMISALRTGDFHFSDSFLSVRVTGGCDPLRPGLSFYTITPK